MTIKLIILRKNYGETEIKTLFYMDPPFQPGGYAQQRDHWDSVKHGSVAVGATMALQTAAFPNPVTPIAFNDFII